jgi:Fur family ferric uptake transcriptional regulator
MESVLAHAAQVKPRMELRMERKTTQRQAICQAFVDSDQPMSPAEVLAAAKRKVSGIGIATVYRAIKSLLDEEWLTTVEIPGQPPRYEQFGKPHHHHFLCSKCGKMFEVDGCPKNLATLVPQGFKLERHEILLYGKCATCAIR